MALFFFMILTLLVPATAAVIFFYLRSSFDLLELVKNDNALWMRLNRPEKTWVREQGGGFATIQPLFPWLGWVWEGNTSGLRADIARQVTSTSKLLRSGLTLFASTCLAIIVLVISAE
ncbi:MAG: hypothetical protein WC213_00550 [Arenimonas sp.]|jgi:hypothetical protein